ncbi:Intermediate filament protein family-containing protein [Strongyloides ratti]|uniref:Intermediate filament protein family-containing protein n=1 Tax=Strongyloides ratti TaxID=34506 RepID=A0A090KPZ0_STRRB|nr:Intermediate filament protein family-containing protein [Strongyloides ratti]CEF59449.1 Intermediate filament protein family-containing protein [Strongyloides ratti]
MKSDQLCTLIISYGDPADDSKQFTTAHSFYGTDPNEYPQTRRLIHNASLLPCITQSTSDADLTIIRKGRQPIDHLNVKTITNYKSIKKENGIVKEIDNKQPKMNVHEVTVKYEGYYPNKSKNYINVIHDNVKSHEIKDITSSNYKQLSRTTFDYSSKPSELVNIPSIPKTSPPRDDIIKPKIIYTTFTDKKSKDEKQKIRKDLDYVNVPKVTHFGVYDDSYTGSYNHNSNESLHEYSRSKSSPPYTKTDKKDKIKYDEQYDISDKSISPTSPIMSTYEQIEMAKKIQKEMQTWKFRNGKPVSKETHIDDDDSISGKSGGRYGLDTRELSYIDSAYESTKGEYYIPNKVTSPKVVTTFEATPAYAIPDDDSIKSSIKSFKTIKPETMTSRKEPYSSTHQLRTHETIISETIETEHRIIKSIKCEKDDKAYAEPAIVKNGEKDYNKRNESTIQCHSFKDNIDEKYHTSKGIYKETYSAISKSLKNKDSTSKKHNPYEVTNIVNLESPKISRPLYDSNESYSSTKLIKTIKTTKKPSDKVKKIIKPLENIITKDIDIKKEEKYNNYYKNNESTSITIKEPQMVSTHIVKNLLQPKKKEYKQIYKNIIIEECTNKEIRRYKKDKKPFYEEKKTEEIVEKLHEIQPIPLIKKPIEIKKTSDDNNKTTKDVIIHTQDFTETNRSKLIKPSPIIPIPKIPKITQTETNKYDDKTPPSKPQRLEDISSVVLKRTIETSTDDLITTKEISVKKPSAIIQIPSLPTIPHSEDKKQSIIVKTITKNEGTNTDKIIEKPRTRSPSPQWRYEKDEIIDTTKIIEEKKKIKSADTESSAISSDSREKVKNVFDNGTEYGTKMTEKKQFLLYNNAHSSLVTTFSSGSSNKHESNSNNMFSNTFSKHNYDSYNSSNMHSTYKSAISPRVGIEGVKHPAPSSNTGFSKVFVETCKYSAGMSSMSQSTANRIRDDREREKKEMSILNDRLASYIEKVRFLGAQNRKLKADLDLLRSRCGKESYSVKEMYEKEIYEAKELCYSTNKEREELEKTIHLLLDEIRMFRDKYDDVKNARELDRDMINKLIQQLCEMESEIKSVRQQIENLNYDVVDLKKENASLLQEIQKTRNDIDQETLNKIDYQNQVQTLLEEIRFITEANEQEIIDLQHMAYRDTTAETRESFKQELSSAINDIREEHNQICEAQRTEMESWYRIKVQEIHTKTATKELEQSYCKEEVRKLRSQCIDIRGRLSELESRNAILEKQAEDLRCQMSDEARSYEAQIADRDNQINKMKNEANTLMIELQLLLDKKATLDAEIAIYKSLLDGEANRVGLSQLTDRVKGYTFSKETVIDQKRVVKGEHTSRSGFQRSAKGNVSIIEASLNGNVITIENSNRSKAENIGNWQLKRLIGGPHPKEITYTFPKDFILYPLKTVKIYARNEGVHNPPDSIVTNEETFGTGAHVQTFLYNANGEERATFMQKSNIAF